MSGAPTCSKLVTDIPRLDFKKLKGLIQGVFLRGRSFFGGLGQPMAFVKTKKIQTLVRTLDRK